MRFKRLVLLSFSFTSIFFAVPSAVQGLSEPTFVIDPNLTTSEQSDATQIRSAISKAASQYGIAGFTAVIFAPSSAGANWAHSELDKISCPLAPAESLLSATAVADVAFGRCIVFKATPVSYPNVAKDTESIAFHEVFHLAQAIRGGQKAMGARFDEMRWIYEGSAELAGYQPQVSSGRITQNALISLLRDSAMNTSSTLAQVSNAWVDNSIALVSNPYLRTNAMYARSYLATYYLSTISSSEKVLQDYFAESGKLGDHVAAFNSIFGITVGEFDMKFSSWINTWTPQATVTPKSDSVKQPAKFGSSCNPINAKRLIGSKKAICKRVSKKLVWVRN